jgi:hypothetical protein
MTKERRRKMERKALEILNELIPILPVYGEKKGKIVRDGDHLFYYLEVFPPRPEAGHSGGFYLFDYEEGEISEWGSYLHPQTCDKNVRAFYARFIVDHENDLRELTEAYSLNQKIYKNCGRK